MLVLLNDKQYNKNNIILLDRNTNAVMNNGYFHRMYYSNQHFTMNGIYLHYNLDNIVIQEDFNKIVIFMQNNYYNFIYESIKNIEKGIANKYYPYMKKVFVSKIADYFGNNKIRLFNDNHIKNGTYEGKKLILKMSGLWETENQYGVTFKLLLS
jgi:hypothetical protein